MDAQASRQPLASLVVETKKGNTKMTPYELRVLNSLVTFAAENIPGGLKSDEQEVARVVGAWALDGAPVHQVCPHCHSVALPSGVDGGHWRRSHLDNSFHRWLCNMKKLGQRLK